MEHMTSDTTTSTDHVASIVAALEQVLDSPLPDIGPDTRLFAELGLDSTSVLELLMVLEDTIGVEFDVDSLEQHHFETVQTLADYVSAQRDDAP